MTEPRNPLFPLFRARLPTDIVTAIYLSEGPWTIQSLSELAGADRKNVTDVVNMLEGAGVVTTTRIGRSRAIQANRSAPFYRPLLELLIVVQGPPRVVADALGHVPGVVGAYVFGSWAARANGEDGPQPRDIDVVVIVEDDPDRIAVLEALESAERLLHRSVNPTFATRRQWHTSEDPFLAGIRSGPLVEAIPLKASTA